MSNKQFWSKEEKNFAADFKKIEEAYKANDNKQVALEKLFHLAERMKNYEKNHPNNKPVNLLQIVVCSLQSKILDDQEKFEETKEKFEEIRARLKLPHELSAEQQMKLLREYSDFLAFFGDYQEALTVGKEALMPDRDGNIPSESMSQGELKYHLSRLYYMLDCFEESIQESRQALKIYNNLSASTEINAQSIIENKILVAEFLRELYQQQDQIWKSDLFDGYVYFEKEEYAKAEESFLKAQATMERLFEIFPDVLKADSEFYEFVPMLFEQLAFSYSKQGKFAEAHEARWRSMHFIAHCYTDNNEEFVMSFSQTSRFSSNCHFFSRNYEMKVAVFPADVGQAQRLRR